MAVQVDSFVRDKVQDEGCSDCPGRIKAYLLYWR